MAPAWPGMRSIWLCAAGVLACAVARALHVRLRRSAARGTRDAAGSSPRLRPHAPGRAAGAASVAASGIRIRVSRASRGGIHAASADATATTGLVLLGEDLIAMVLAHMDEYSLYAVALTCSQLLEAARRRRGTERAFRTNARHFVTSVTGLEWALSAGWSGARACTLAAESGSLDVLVCAHDRLGFAFDLDTSAAAARRGSVEMLRAIRARGGYWDSLTCAGAAEGGHLDTLIWAREHGCSWGPDTCASAARAGNLAVLQWAREHGCVWRADTCARAARGGHLDVVRWCVEHGAPVDAETCAAAARGGHLDVIRFCREEAETPFPWGTATPALAALGGHIDVLIYCRAHAVPPCPWDAETCACAALGGHLACLVWAYTHGCEMTAETCTAALRAGHLHVLRWALAYSGNATAWLCQAIIASEGERGDVRARIDGLHELIERTMLTDADVAATDGSVRTRRVSA